MSQVSTISVATAVASVFHARRRRIDAYEIFVTQATQHLKQASVSAPHIEDAILPGRNVLGE
jgi:hypothetical protein